MIERKYRPEAPFPPLPFVTSEHHHDHVISKTFFDHGDGKVKSENGKHNSQMSGVFWGALHPPSLILFLLLPATTN